MVRKYSGFPTNLPMTTSSKNSFFTHNYQSNAFFMLEDFDI